MNQGRNNPEIFFCGTKACLWHTLYKDLACPALRAHTLQGLLVPPGSYRYVISGCEGRRYIYIYIYIYIYCEPEISHWWVTGAHHRCSAAGNFDKLLRFRLSRGHDAADVSYVLGYIVGSSSVPLFVAPLGFD